MRSIVGMGLGLDVEESQRSERAEKVESFAEK